MLKLRAPIEIKSRRDFVHDNEGFYDRISGNYSFLGRDIGSEELLHIANTPPEVYLAEGDLTTVSGNTVINSRNEEKLEIINNVLNRIVVSADANLTYQDRAYITDVLYKMGIKDDRTFMNEVRRIINETREEDRLINMFLMGNTLVEGDHINEELLSLVNRVGNLEERNEDLYLSENIMRRLETGAIYQIVSNFNRSVNEKSLSINEFSVTGQSDAAKMILTERIRENYLKEGADLIYRETEETETVTEETTLERREGERLINNSIYIGGSVYEREILSGEKTDVNIMEELGSALFLDIVKNLISNSFERSGGVSHQWFDFRNVIYNSSENLFRRIAYISEENRISGESIENIFEGGSVDITYRNTAEEILREYLDQENLNEEFRRNEEINNRTVNLTEETVRGGDINRFSESTTNVDITYPVTEEESEREIRTSEIESFERELIRLNEKNLNNVEKYRQMMSLIQNYERVRTEPGGKDRTRKEALKALEGELDVARMFEEAETNEEERKDRLFKEIVRIFPDSAGELFNVIENYLGNPAVTAENISIINNNLEEAAEEIRRFQERPESTPEPEIRETFERQEELIFRENATLDMEEIRENIEELRKNVRTRTELKSDDVITDQRTTERRNIISTTNSSFTNEEVMDIEEMVNRGVRSQMGIISEQVMNKLERRLRDEKSRRGI